MAKSKKVNKWEAAPESIRKLKEAINGTADGMSIIGGLNTANDWEQHLIDILGKVLDDYNELEAKHNADCGLISKLEVENKKYETLAVELESKLDRVTRERNNIEYTLDTLIEQLKVKNDIYVNPEASSTGIYKVENKHAAVLQEDLDAVILDLRKEGEHSQALSKVITRKNAEMCNLKWERDETEKKLKILTEELTRQYNIHVTFYQKPGIDMHGFRNFGVHVDCEENRKVFNDLKEALDKHKSQINKLEEKHAKATRFISRLTEALNDAGVEFHYVKFGGDGEEIFHIDSVVDKCAKRHYEEQSSLLRDTIRNYAEQIRCFKKDIRDLETKIYKLTEDNEDRERRTGLLFLALDRAGIHPIFDNRANKWRIQYTGKAENAFLAADQIKRDAEKKIDKLVSALDKCRLDVKWDHENDKWCIYVQPSDTELTSVSVNLCEVVEGYEKLKEENNNLKQTLLNILRTLETKVGLCRIHLLDSYEDRANLIAVEHDRLLIKYEKLKNENNDLITDTKRLSHAVEAWFNLFDDMRHKRDFLKKENEALKKRLNAIYGYRDTDNPCGICKNFDPKE